MFIIDAVLKRKENQIDNYKLVEDALCEGDLSIAKERGNPNKYNEILDYLGIDAKSLLRECKSEVVRKLVAMNMSKLSTRQGGALEHEILEGINGYTQKFGVYVKSLPNTALRPLRKGGVITNAEMKKSGVNKKIDTLKSIDGLISGNVDGYIFAKVMTGKGGGHQDNVIIEAHNFIDWASKESKDKLYVVLIDGDYLHTELPKLLERDNMNIWVCDHIKFQERIAEKVRNDKR